MHIKSVNVTFDQAKLLREIGFKLDHYKSCYSLDGKYLAREDPRNSYSSIVEKEGELGELINPDVVRREKHVIAPEHWQLVDWLLIEKDIWVNVDRDGHGRFKWIGSDKSSLGWETPQEAYSEAFDYILEFLKG